MWSMPKLHNEDTNPGLAKASINLEASQILVANF
jgi:hypothetical protein